ncbi:hypothetical protein OG301_36215 [Streptomyces platensis]|uniref:hypothetical protein n=1 Tax=Streptomyces TaxID=1883 RepID=UPI000F8DE4D7|nr:MULTISPECIES: hypothetical protein [Streptomyces]WSI53757.1 hypothetical protein OG229_03025 [Streptomyces platensis]WSX24589.1 hypothetical protein OG690_35495 [Streptomyces tubercidicus]WTI56343.1 hypothetical protein OG301_36215 [Streptomyces platensis]WUB78171.1 hypothetical protein OG424_02570 [Streptomyces platensis]
MPSSGPRWGRAKVDDEVQEKFGLLFAEPNFECEREICLLRAARICHGPGLLHVKSRSEYLAYDFIKFTSE